MLHNKTVNPNSGVDSFNGCMFVYTGEPQLATPSSYFYLNLRCIVYLNGRHFTNQRCVPWLVTSSNVRFLK